MTNFSDSLGESASYGYYSDGLRASKTIGSDTIKYYYDGSNVINETKNGSSYATNVVGVNGYISRRQNGTAGYLFKDAHGDILSAYSSTTNKLADYTYDAWGNSRSENETSSFNNNPLRYCGEYYDYESGMTYFRARYYDSTIRRFITEDPAKDGLNWYVYCANNPVNYTDPMGLWEPGDEKLSQEAQSYIKYYTEGWKEANKAYQNATTDAERASAQQSMDFYHAAAGDIRYLDSKGQVTGTTHDVQVFNQGTLNLCWAYCQVMIEDFQAGGGMTQAQAAARAQAIAESVYGTGQNPNGSFVWNQGGWPTNSQDVTNQVPSLQAVGSFNDLSKFISNSPIYAYYSNGLSSTNQNSAAHLIVVTGVVSASGHPNLVTSNNPWGNANIQTHNGFMAGIPRDRSNPVMTFGGILRP